ncbi:tryptase beta-2-like isoform X2 [Bacillus rossius redtenbacheri]|uniref:tryptase beta-2-like isoform X2 n=1 Tax=Bacillus rossius redtenbacheri TaxID=93214 RepID=UPI002FDDDB09
MKIHRKLRKGWILCCVFCLFPLTSLKECGISKSASRRQPRNVITWTGRIISGQESPKGAWPWQVSLELLHPRHGYIGHWCGGVLIYSQWVLTAAHCIHNDVFSLPLAALWTAVFGEWDRDVNEETEVRVPIEKIFVHERFNNYQNDIGWGHAAVQGSLVARLLESQIPLRDNSACQAKYGKWVAIRAGHLCAGHTDGSTGTCVGDSGGPLQCKQHGRWFLAGITSFGSGCAKPGYPDVYTRLSFYLPWIMKKINSTSSSH